MITRDMRDRLPYVQFLRSAQPVHVPLIDLGEGDARLDGAILDVFLRQSGGMDLVLGLAIGGVDLPERVLRSHLDSNSKGSRRTDNDRETPTSTQRVEQMQSQIRGAYLAKSRCRAPTLPV